MITPHVMKGETVKNTLLLIDPYPPPDQNPYRMNPREMRAIWFPKLSLPSIASYTPSHWDKRIIDESRDLVTPGRVAEWVAQYGKDNLFVGLSTQMTCYAPRAYQVADWFRSYGVRVVIGGNHATYLTEEALTHADAVVQFEADDLWMKVISDFEQSQLRRVYTTTTFPSLVGAPFPRIDLLPRNSYMTPQVLQTQRGCHFECDFCSVSPFNGKSSRRRPVDEVVAEIEHIRQCRKAELIDGITKGPLWHRVTTSLSILTGLNRDNIFAFVDDLHNSNRDYCKKLWKALKELNIKWGSQVTLFMGDDPELVKLAADSGCVAVFVGMESIMPGSISEMNKPFNMVEKYEAQIKCFHDHGIMVNPGMIFGADHEDESVFERTVDWLVRQKVELAYFNILTPLPGTPLYDRMNAEGRIIDTDWSHYDGKYVVYRPKRMSPEVLLDGFFWANQKFFSWPSILTRILGTPQRMPQRLYMNWRFRQLIYRTTPGGKLTRMSKLLVDFETNKEKVLERLRSYGERLERQWHRKIEDLQISANLIMPTGEERLPKMIIKLTQKAKEVNIHSFIRAHRASAAAAHKLRVSVRMEMPLMAMQKINDITQILKEKKHKKVSFEVSPNGDCLYIP